MNKFFKNDSFYNYILLKINKEEIELKDLDDIKEVSIKNEKNDKDSFC